MDLIELSAYGNVRRGQDTGGCRIQWEVSALIKNRCKMKIMKLRILVYSID